MTEIRNPILPGFNPDPSICRVGDDFYIATSTFQWFPGVQIHHSRDLVNWRLLCHPLTRQSQLDMTGDPDSGGIWAPCLSWCDGLFYLVYTDVKWLDGVCKDTLNYVVTAADIQGPWSEPIYLNASGFDPSLFHDDDGRKWVVNQIWDFRLHRNRFAGIALQEYDPKQRQLVGPIANIFPGTDLGCTEGPHLYKRNGLYYLMLAEGGTGINHAVTVARSSELTGPYEVDPNYPMLTSRGDKSLPLQKAGHASLVDTPDGQWYLVHLCGRPIGEHGRCILGRETAIQQVIWDDQGWLRLAGGGNRPGLTTTAPGLPSCPWPESVSGAGRCDFTEDQLPVHFQSLRVPMTGRWLSLTDRPGCLRLYGRQSLFSLHQQSLVARRVQAFVCQASTQMTFAPEDFQQMAGLIAYYDTRNWYYLRVSHDRKLGVHLGIDWCDNRQFHQLPADQQVALPEGAAVQLRLLIDHEQLQFVYRLDNDGPWLGIGSDYDATHLSDDYGDGWCFTGAFVGLCCQDLSGRSRHADFHWFEYLEKHGPRVER